MVDSVRQRLRARLTSGPLIVAPGIYDAYGARFVEQAGFEAVYMTGNGVSASLLGCPDVGLIDLTLIASHAHRVAACVDIPLICDADTGYGNAGSLELLDRAPDIDCVAVTGIGIADQRNVDAGRDAVRMARDQRKVDQADIGTAEQRRRHAIAGHIHRFESRLLDETRAVGIVNPGRDDQRSACEPRA